MIFLFEKNLQNYALFGALVLYGLLGSPTPDTLSWAEIAIGLLLLLAAGINNIAMIFSGAALWHKPLSRKILTALFLISLYPALMLGFLMGHRFADMIRDIIPLGFFFLPAFFHGKNVEKPLLYGIVFTGVVFALRFWPESGLTLARFGMNRGNDELLYLTSSPAVLFSGLYLLFIGTSVEKQSYLRRLSCLVASMICLLTIAATLQRGALFLAGLMIFFVFFNRIQRSPRFLYGCLAALLLGGIWLAPVIADIIALIWRKTLVVGDNARFAELRSVFDALGNDPWSYLTGQGWGAKIVTAASGYAEVRYTHMLFSYTLLKSGLIGLVALGGYAAFIGHRLVMRLPERPLVICAALPSLILGFTLYPSFKMLCFGVILTLLAISKQTSESNHDPV